MYTDPDHIKWDRKNQTMCLCFWCIWLDPEDAAEVQKWKNIINVVDLVMRNHAW